jgi:tetratricopeptide (TPR) repeat protein
MTVRQVLTFSGATGMLLMLTGGSLSAQGIPKGARISRGPQAAATRIMVATPYVFTTADSAKAVAVGQSMRGRMARQASRGDYAVIADSTMNRALLSFGYAPDAILNQESARKLAQSLAGRVLVTSQMVKSPEGSWSMVSRLAGVNDDAGVTVRVTQTAGSPLTAMGAAAIDSFKQGLEVLADARECMDQRATKPEQARKKAEDVLKQMPNNGLAHYCLAQLAKDTATMVKELTATVAGDSLSLRAMTQLAALYEAKGDTAQTVTMLQQMLRAAPTDQELRQRAFRYFLVSGRAQAAIEVADEGLKLDPTNWDLWDLKSNACLFSSNFRCAVQSLEQAYATDSTRADTLFFAKIQVAAEQQLADTTAPEVATAADTATFVKWAQIGAKRFPQNITLLKNVNKAYSFSGQVDSSLAVTRRLLAADTTDVTPALAAAQALIKANRYPDAAEFFTFVQQHGDDNAKAQSAGLLVNAAVPLLQATPARYDTAAIMLRQGVTLAPNASFAPTMYYLLGLSDLQLASSMDKATESAKSCEGAQKMDSLLVEAAPALEKGKAFRADEATKLLANVTQYRERTQGMIKAYCK